jgi:two-component system response regulator YesN
LQRVPGDSITTLLVDDEPDIRLVMRLAIELEDEGVSIIGEAENGEQAIQRARDLAPTVVVLDIRMPHVDGLSVAQQILADNPEQAIVLCSAHLDPVLRHRALALGVRECVDKIELPDIAKVVRRVVSAA